jgi:formate dehydrogenase major subunit
MTNVWMDIKNADLIVVMGGNAAEAHPCGFKWVIEAKIKNNARLIVVDPRFTRTASVADFYCPIRPGTDIAFLNGVTKYLLDNDKIHHAYVKAYSNAGYVVREGYDFQDGLFTGYNADERTYDTSTWEYETDPDGYAVVDDTMQHPRCVMQLLRRHVAAYTPEMVERICGSSREKFLKVCEMIATTATPDKVMTSLYALGWTHHSKGSQNIRGMCVVQTLLGNIGMPGGGMNALRGHSNIQGLTDLGLMSELLPGYMDLPMERDKDLATYMSRHQFKPLRPGQTSYWQNYSKFFVSFMKAMYGKAATADNDYAFNYLPKRDLPTYDVIRAFDLAKAGKINGYIMQGFNPLMTFPDQAKMREGLSKLKFLVVMDPLQTETARFWENHGVYNDVKTASIQTEVFELPTTCFAEDEGSLSNSSRWLQWHWPAQPPPFEARSDIDIIAALHKRMRDLYQQEGGAFPEPILNLNWPYQNPESPRPDEIAREINGYAVDNIPDPTDPARTLIPTGRQLDSFAQLRDDGKTASGCWIYSGCFTEQGNMMARRDTSDPDNRGIAPHWAWAWPANRRVLYNRASADPDGNPWSETKKLIWWNGSQWVGYDTPDYGPAVSPKQGVGPFIMNQEGVARLFVRTLMRDGPFPAHYEPFESPRANLLAPKIQGNPAARIFKDDLAALGTSKAFPYVATSYRVTEHFHYWTKHAHINAILQPQQFVEIGEQLAREKGIAEGAWVRVWSNRGELKAKAVVTKRIRPLICDGQPVHVVGIPHHWGFTGLTRKGWSPNALTPTVGDANTQTPEFKAWLVNIEPTTPPPPSPQEAIT